MDQLLLDSMLTNIQRRPDALHVFTQRNGDGETPLDIAKRYYNDVTTEKLQKAIQLCTPKMESSTIFQPPAAAASQPPPSPKNQGLSKKH